MQQERTHGAPEDSGAQPPASHAPRVGAVTVATLVATALVAGAALGYSLAFSEVRQARSEAAAARDDLNVLGQAHEKLHERSWQLFLEARDGRSAERGQHEPAEPGTFTDGTYRVGTDIEPGTYLGEVDGEFGYWARLRGTTGMVSAIITNDVVRGPFVLTIIPSDVAVELRGVTLRPEE